MNWISLPYSVLLLAAIEHGDGVAIVDADDPSDKGLSGNGLGKAQQENDCDFQHGFSSFIARTKPPVAKPINCLKRVEPTLLPQKRGPRRFAAHLGWRSS